MDEVEYEDIDLLGDEFHHALVGAVFEDDGTPVPCYLSGLVVDQLMSEGLTEDQAIEYVSEVTDGTKVLWIHPLELRPEFTPDNKPHLRLVH